jgi:hypothetical protein
MRQTTIFMSTEFAQTQVGDGEGLAGVVDKPDRVIGVTMRDLQQAAVEGVITNLQASKLWNRIVATGIPIPAKGEGPTFVPSPGYMETMPQPLLRMPHTGPGFRFVNVLYYFGGLMAIGAMSMFMTLGFEMMGAGGLLAISLAYLVGCLKVADHFKRRRLAVPAGLLATLAVVLVPLAVWCVQQLLGLWPPGGTDSFRSYHTVINWRWIFLEFATLAAGTVMLWRYKLPFMVMPVAITIWYMSMDVANALMQNEGFDWKFTRDVSLVFGLGTIAMAMWVDARTRRARSVHWRKDFAFWLYIMGAVMFWSGLTMQDSGSEIGKFVYALINIAMVFGGAAIGRRVFTVFGALGVAGYLGYLSHRVFNNSLMFPFALTLLGLGVVALGVWWQRNETKINARLARYVPVGLRPRA